MPVGEIFAGAFLGGALHVLHEAIKNAKDRSLTATCILDRLEATLLSITPFVAQVDKLSEEVEDSPRKVIEDLKVLLEKAVALVNAYAELSRRNLLKKFRYKRRIKELEASLRWMVDLDVQVNQLLKINEIMAKMSEMNIKLDEITRRFESSQSLSSQTSNQSIVEETTTSSQENAQGSPKIIITVEPL